MENQHIKSIVNSALFYTSRVSFEDMRSISYNEVNVFLKYWHQYETDYIRLTQIEGKTFLKYAVYVHFKAKVSISKDERANNVQ